MVAEKLRQSGWRRVALLSIGRGRVAFCCNCGAHIEGRRVVAHDVYGFACNEQCAEELECRSHAAAQKGN